MEQTGKIYGTIFDVRRFATHDGGGIRTTVFFKGCPLLCAWCHNPEGISTKRRPLYFEKKCIHCGSCVNESEFGGVKFSDGKIVTEDDLITLAAHAEFYSTHPISASLKSVHHCPDCQKVSSSDLSEISGHGVKAVLDGHNILCGNLKLMQKENVIGLHECSKEDFGTLVHVSCDGVYLGHIVINDTCKENSASIVKVLKKNGVEKTVMLTGDSRQAAESVSVKLGVDEVYSELLPEDKVMKVEELIKDYEGTGKKVLFAGDGINDAPVLSRSDVGVSMGAMGSDSAIEASDVVIMDDNVLKIAEAIRLSKKIMRNVWENVAGALGVKLLIMILCALGIANMWIAVFGDVGVCMLCVLNSMRLTLGGVKPRKTL